MCRSRFVLILCFFIFQENHGVAQQSLVHGADAYSGLHGAAINPAQLSFNQRTWGLHLPSSGIGFQNNNVQLDRLNLFALAFGRSYRFELDNTANRASNAEADVFLRADFEKPSFLRVQTWTMGLGGYVQRGRHAFGLSFGGRSFVELTQLSSGLATHLFEGFRFDSLLNQPINASGLRFNLIGFTESNFTWTYRNLETRTRASAIGFTAKLMNVQQSTHLDFKQLDYQVRQGSDTFLLNDLAGTYGRSVGRNGIWTGGGLAFDLGFTYVKVDESPVQEERASSRINCFDFSKPRRRKESLAPAHRWKLGVSLLDVGLLRVNALDYLMVGQDIPIGLREQLFDFSTDPFDATLVERVDSFGLLVAKAGYTVGAATALSMQFDYQLLPDFYVHTAITQRLPVFGQYKLGRVNHFVIAPRLERYWASFSMPVSVWEYRYPQIGFSARMGPLSFGTDRLGELFGIRRVRGLDAYLSIDLFRFWR
jgi:hypothetical protein